MLSSSANSNEVILQEESEETVEVTENGIHKDGVKDSTGDTMTRTLILNAKEPKVLEKVHLDEPSDSGSLSNLSERNSLGINSNTVVIKGRNYKKNDFNDRSMSNQTYRNSNIISSNEMLNITSISGKNFNAATLQSNLPEDMRISKLLRRLCVEKNPTSASELCGKLKTVILEPNNTAYIRRSFDILTDSIVYLLKECPQECLDDVIEIFGMMGYVIRHDVSSYKTWIVKSYKNQQLRIPIMKALLKTLKMDANTRDMMPLILPKFIELLKDYLDAAEKTELFVVITNTIKQFSLNYPRIFEPHFTDIVDIVVGWHLETDQTDEFKEHCSDILQGFHLFWTLDTNFANNLLSQFLEDIIVSENEMDGRVSPSYERSTPPEMSIASLIGAFNSVMKCTWESSDKLVKTVGKDLLMESFEVSVCSRSRVFFYGQTLSVAFCFLNRKLSR